MELCRGVLCSLGMNGYVSMLLAMVSIYRRKKAVDQWPAMELVWGPCGANRHERSTRLCRKSLKGNLNNGGLGLLSSSHVYFIFSLLE